jgi:CheY-like chemotaxis protein/HPt (histidine-containing phosphotransfer) domain-containing protein
MNDTLEFEEITNNQLQLEKTPFDIIETAEVILKTFQPKATEKNIQLYFEKNTKNLLVVGDSFRLSQIINNLLSNAVKFTDAGSVTFSISVSPMNDTDVCIDFKVRDTGIGIKKANLKKIFLPYVQESSSTTRFYGGTGLGLTITNKLLQLFGSELKIKSQKNKGSEFSFSLQLPLSTKGNITKKGLITDALELEGKKILVAEDTELNRFLIQKILEGTNCKFKFVFNGEEAVKEVKNKDFDLILMDIEMPLMNGIEATKLIRKSRKAAIKNIPIIALTANTSKENRKEYLKTGINDYISKPFTKLILLTTIAKVLNIQFSKQRLNLEEEAKELNLGYIKSLSNDPEFLKKALRTFSNDSTKLIYELELSIEKNNLENCLSILHKLKSAAGITGMKRTRKSILQLEMKLKKKKNLSDYMSLFDSIINDFKKAIAEVYNLHI